jgi:hypothetical protein
MNSANHDLMTLKCQLTLVCTGKVDSVTASRQTVRILRITLLQVNMSVIYIIFHTKFFHLDVIYSKGWTNALFLIAEICLVDFLLLSWLVYVKIWQTKKYHNETFFSWLMKFRTFYCKNYLNCQWLQY